MYQRVIILADGLQIYNVINIQSIINGFENGEKET
jgi:hypothetical protein